MLKGDVKYRFVIDSVSINKIAKKIIVHEYPSL